MPEFAKNVTEPKFGPVSDPRQRSSYTIATLVLFHFSQPLACIGIGHR